jgi:hypothetical protein
MNCTGCNACRTNGGHCKYEDFDIVLSGDSKPIKYITLPQEQYDEMQDKLKRFEADEYLDMPVIMRDKRELICVDKEEYESMKDKIRRLEEDIRRLRISLLNSGII